MAETIRVNNKTAGGILLHGANKKNEDGSVRMGSSHMLAPGFNDVPGQLFRESISHKSSNGEETFSLVEKMRDEGKLDWEGDGSELDHAAKPIAKMNEREAIRIVKETFSPIELVSYKAMDSRPAVQKAIAEQLKAGDEAIAKGRADGKGMKDTEERAV